MKFNIKTLALRVAVAAAIVTPFAAQAFTAGPGSWSSNQTWAADSVNGGNLTGYFYWPASQPTNSAGRALILVLHGCTQTAAAQVINNSTDGGFNWKATADAYGAVVLAPNATGNLYSNHCWDYANTGPTRTTGHTGILLDLINRFVTNSSYAIDPNQVYVTGLSSGGGMTMVLGCLAPDIFSGVGINAGPAPGTTTAQIGAVPSGVTSATAANICKGWAGTHTASFNTQIANAVWGSSDYTVGQAYGPLDTGAFRIIYGGTFTKGSNFTVTGGSGNGTGVPYTDSNGKLRTTEITVSGMSHAWPAGPGGQNANYVDATRINYPNYITSFFFTNNLRMAAGGTTTTTAAGTTTTTAAGTTTTTTATTTTTTAGACYNASNYAHVQAGRAHDSVGTALANGSNASMGLDNTFYTSKLRMTGTNYYIIDSTCP